MYTVRYSQSGVGSAYRPVLFESASVDACVQVALNVHRASNVEHNVTVQQECEEPKIFREILFLTTQQDEEVPESPAYGFNG